MSIKLLIALFFARALLRGKTISSGFKIRGVADGEIVCGELLGSNDEVSIKISPSDI